MSAKRRLSSAYASTQADESLRCLPDGALDSMLLERLVKTQIGLRIRGRAVWSVFAGRHTYKYVGHAVARLILYYFSFI